MSSTRPTDALEECDGPPVVIRVEDLYKSFSDTAVLNGVTLEIRRGEIVAFVGASGCGKTVLLEHIIGHLSPDRGRVLITDHEHGEGTLVELSTLTEDALDRIRVHWAVVFQRNALFTGTVYENIALWLREVKRLDESEIRRRAERAIVQVGLDTSVLDTDRDELSGGMAKRVAVARAIAMDPAIIFYDEPTTGLDPTHAANIQELIVQMHGGGERTTVIITHDKDLLRRLEPRIIMLDEGRVFFDGTYEAFQRSESPVIRPYFEQMPVLQRRPARD